MRAFLVLAVCVATPSAAGEPDVPQQRASAPSARLACEDHSTTAAANGKAMSARPLGQEPNARQLLAVVRIVDGCNRPVTVREQIGFRGR